MVERPADWQTTANHDLIQEWLGRRDGEGAGGHQYWDADGDVLPASGTTVRVETAGGERVLTETYKSGR